MVEFRLSRVVVGWSSWSSAFAWLFGGARYGWVEDAGLTGTLAGEGLHGGGHVDGEVGVGVAAIRGGWRFDRVDGCCRLGDVGGEMMEKRVVVILVGFEWLGFGFHFALFG